MKKGTEPKKEDARPQPSAAPKSTVTRSMRVRAALMAGVFILVGFGAVIYNLYQLQIVQHEELATRAENQQLADETIVPNRGVIYDCDMKVLARSNRVWTVVASPRDMAKSETDINMVAQKLAELLEMDVQDILERLEKTDSNYQRLKRQVEKPVADAITEWIAEYNATDDGKDKPIVGITLEQDAKRYYPYQTLASTVIGFVNADGDGVLGLEHYYNDLLKGTAGRVVGMKNAWGYDLPNASYEAAYDAQDGYGLVLTINTSIQSTLEKYLQNAVDQYHVENRAVGIVMDVNTGAIYAMATMPDYNLQEPYTISDPDLAALIAAIQDDEARANERYTAQWAQWRNKAVSDLYYPGSVFKTITAAAALDSGAAALTTTYTCYGSIEVAGIKMRCAHTNHGTLDFFGGLDGSCNPYFVTLGQRMGAQTFCDYMQAFGFYEKTGIDMDDEGTTQYVPLERMGPVELASSSFGQTTSTTPLQMITAASAVINGGYLVQPHVLKQILDADGNLIQNMEPEVKRQVISSETSETMRELLVRSVNLTNESGQFIGGNSTGYISGYSAGGKSGTSQRSQSRGDEEQTYYSSYWGFAPGDNPQIAVLVMLDTPHDENGTYYGGRLAAPVVKSVLDEALQTLGVPKQYSERELEKEETTVPDVVTNGKTMGQPVNTASSTLRDAGFNVDISRVTGDTVLYQYPAAGTQAPRQSTVILYSEDRTDGGGDLVTVPDLADLGYDSVCATLRSQGLNIREGGVIGGGKNIIAVDQNIPAGTQVEMGTIIEVTFHNTQMLD
ncbi:MAG: PASTA domain-containing protein [Subdoligranulum sp.]|nr:PASTA domain-containing protein [Subdoligranulum sp.]